MRWFMDIMFNWLVTLLIIKILLWFLCFLWPLKCKTSINILTVIFLFNFNKYWFLFILIILSIIITLLKKCCQTTIVHCLFIVSTIHSEANSFLILEVLNYFCSNYISNFFIEINLVISFIIVPSKNTATVK